MVSTKRLVVHRGSLLPWCKPFTLVYALPDLEAWQTNRVTVEDLSRSRTDVYGSCESFRFSATRYAGLQ